MVGHNQDGRLGTNNVVKQLIQNCHKLTKKAQVEACKTDVHRYCRKVSNIFPFQVKKQNHYFEVKKIYEPEIQARPKKSKKYNFVKNYKEQPREIHDQSNDMQDEEGFCILTPFLHWGPELFHRKVSESFMNLLTVDSEEDNACAHVDWHMKQSRHSSIVSQGNYIKRVVYDRKSIQNCYNIPRKTQVKVYRCA